MVSQVNCYTLSQSVIDEGIKLKQSSRGGYLLAIGPEWSQKPVGLGDMRQQFQPVTDNGLLLRGRIVEIQRQLRVVEAPSWDGLLLRVIAQKLNFRVNPFVRGLNINPGAEGIQAIVQRGNHRDRIHKDQLFRVEHNQTLLAIDQKGAVLSITCLRGVPIVRPTPREALVAYILKYGLGARGRSQVVWAMHTISSLGLKTPVELQEKLARLSA